MASTLFVEVKIDTCTSGGPVICHLHLVLERYGSQLMITVTQLSLQDRNAQWERVRAHTVPVSVACFAPKPAIFLSMMQRAENAKRRGANEGAIRFLNIRIRTNLNNHFFAASYRGSAAAWAADAAAAATPPLGDVIISADLSGCIKIMVNRAKPVKMGEWMETYMLLLKSQYLI